MPDADREGPPGPEAVTAPEPAVFAAAAWPGEFRPYQNDALSEVGSRWEDGHRRTWVVLPPGAGKTLVGLEAARRLGRRTVVFAPNIAIQGQWITHWEAYDRPGGGTAGTGRDLEHDVNVLTYQSLAVFDPEAETDGNGSVRDRLHANGQALVEALHDAGPLTVVLDECHHLLQVWGRLLAEILDELPDAHVIGLTGTPAASLTRTEKNLVERLFGEPITGASVPALVRDGYLAPFAELAYVTVPNALEREYLAEEGLRFTEMCAELLTPGFAETDFLAWIDVRFVARFTAGRDEADWNRLADERPEEADAVLRLHHAGLCALPRGARLSERHRHQPDADDWVALIRDYERHCLDPGTERNTAARESIRAALPTVGYQLTRRGIRATASPVDRVLARSAAKSQATVEIVDTESDALGDRLRALVLCDQERARTPRALRGVLAEDAGSAWLQLALLAEDPRTAFLNPVMITGRTVATSPWTSDALIGFVRAERPDLDLYVREVDGLHVIEGTWPPRTRVGLVTRFLDWAGCRVLVGTRALLGEGWDARGINVVVDLTTSTTATAVVQGRGRALRLDPSWPEKTAHTWTVVCVGHDHPKGDADWNRFVRKHEGYLALGTDGGVVSGVAHVDARLSPYEPPREGETDAINARMLIRAGARDRTRAQWRLGEPYEDTLTAALRVWEARVPSGRALALGPPTAAAPPAGPPAVLPAAAGAVRRTEGPGGPESAPRPTHAAAVVRSLAVVAGIMLGLSIGPWPFAVLMSLLCLGATELVAAGARRMAELRAVRRMLEEARAPVGIDRYACAVADALAFAGHSEVGATGVRIHVDAAGVHQCALTGAGPGAAEKFAVALEEVLNPVVSNERFAAVGHYRRCLAVRSELPAAGSAREEREQARAQVRGRSTPNRRVHHAVPYVFERTREGPQAFERAWNLWVSGTPLLYLHTMEAGDALAVYKETAAEVTTGFGLVWS